MLDQRVTIPSLQIASEGIQRVKRWVQRRPIKCVTKRMQWVHSLPGKCTRQANQLVPVQFRFFFWAQLTLFTLLLNTFTRSIHGVGRGEGGGEGAGVNESANRNHGTISMISSGSIPDRAERVLIGISWRVSVSIWNQIEKRHNNKGLPDGEGEREGGSRKTNQNWSKLSKIKAHY